MPGAFFFRKMLKKLAFAKIVSIFVVSPINKWMHMETQDLQTIEYDYLVVIHPDAQVEHDVTHYKAIIAQELGAPGKAFSPVYIPLFRSSFPSKYESDFIDVLTRLSGEQGAFTVYTSRIDHVNAGSDKHNIYVNVANPRPVAALHKSILSAFELEEQGYQPHITLARGLSSDAFDRVQKQLNNRLFVRSFYCHSFLLLRKPLGSSDAYEAVHEFCFGKDDPHDGPLYYHAA